MWQEKNHLDILLVGGDDALPHEEAVVLKELVVLLRILLALVQQEADYSLLQNITELPEARGDDGANINQWIITGTQAESGEMHREYMSKYLGGSVPDERALLQQLSAQIQRDVLTVHHTCRHTMFSSALKIKITFLIIINKIMHPDNPDLAGSATTWVEYRLLWSGSGLSCCTEPHWSPSPCSRQTCSASVDK